MAGINPEYNLNKAYLEVCYFIKNIGSGFTGISDRLLVKLCIEKAVDYFLPEYHQREKIPFGESFFHAVDINLREWGLYLRRKER